MHLSGILESSAHRPARWGLPLRATEATGVSSGWKGTWKSQGTDHSAKSWFPVIDTNPPVTWLEHQSPPVTGGFPPGTSPSLSRGLGPGVDTLGLAFLLSAGLRNRWMRKKVRQDTEVRSWGEPGMCHVTSFRWESRRLHHWRNSSNPPQSLPTLGVHTTLVNLAMQVSRPWETGK